MTSDTGSWGRVLAGVIAAVLAAGLLAFDVTPAAATIASVATEAEYRDALTALSGDDTGPHVIEVTGDIALDDGTDPVYTGTQPLTINGNGHTIDAGGTSRMLYTQTSPPRVLTVNDLNLTNGVAGGAGGALFVTRGSVTVINSTLTGNLASSAGAIWAAESVTVTDSTLAGNLANLASGAIWAEESVTVTNSTLTGNEAVASGAGAISAFDVTLVHATVVDNKSDLALNLSAPGGLESFGSVVASPQFEGSPNCSVAVATTSNGHNYSDDASCGFTGTGDTENGTDPLLGPARDNGSPPTMFPLLGSPLVDAIAVAACDPTVTTDQRGLPRPSDGNDDGNDGCDIGAVELQATPPPTPPTPPPPSSPAPPASPAGRVVGPVAARPTFTG